MAGLAAGGRRLVHDADGRADVHVLRALGQPGELPAAQAEAEEVVQREGDHDLQGGRGGQAGARRDAGREVDVRAGDRVAGLAQGPDDARRVGGPALVGLGGEVVDGELHDPAPDVVGVQAQDAVVAPGHRRHRGVRQGERHDEAVVVVGVLADEVDPAGCRPHPVGRAPYSSSNRAATASATAALDSLMPLTPAPSLPLTWRAAARTPTRPRRSPRGPRATGSSPASRGRWRRTPPGPRGRRPGVPPRPPGPGAR